MLLVFILVCWVGVSLLLAALWAWAGYRRSQLEAAWERIDRREQVEGNSPRAA